jgi:hypothetical protein
VRDKDLARALRFLQSAPSSPIDSSSISNPGLNINSGFGELDWEIPDRDWEILDTCLNADDMRLVGSAYGFLQNRGLLRNFGKCRDIGICLETIRIFRLKFCHWQKYEKLFCDFTV